MGGIGKGLKSFFSSIFNFFQMIKFEHTVFALPFAYMGAFMASRGMPPRKEFILISIAFVSARTYAMTLNRILDLPFDRLNPRTKNRHLITGRVKKKTAYIWALISLFALSYSAYMLGPLVFKLLPIALFFLTFYHLTKRFTYFSHFILGFTDGLAPLGAWIAIRKSAFSLSDIPGWLLLLIVTFWIAGFDIIYQCQDVDFDRKMNLHSIPSRFGIKKALLLARVCHVFMFLGLVLLTFFFDYKLPFVLSLFVTLFLIFLEHSMVSPEDLSKLNVAFFNINGYISIVIFLGILTSLFA